MCIVLKLFYLFISDTRCLFSAWMTCGRVAFAPYFPPGSDKLATVCTQMLSKADCVILQNHGVVCVGSSLQEAFDRFVTLENLAQTIVNAIPLGVPRPLKENILSIKEQRNTSYQKFLRAVPYCPTSCSFPHRVISGHEKEVRSELCQFVERAYKHNIFTSSSGSISIRCGSISKDPEQIEDEVSYLITPTNVDRQKVDPSSCCFISNRACCSSTTGEPPKIIKTEKALYHPTNRDISPSHASEIHATIYSMHPKVNSIIIAQPPFATSFCITGKKLNSGGIPESHLVLGDVKTLPFECLEDGGITLSKTLDLSSSRGITTVLIDGFGLLSVGTDLLKAYVQVEVCESICGIMLTSMRRGTPALLTDDQVKEIDIIFKDGH